MLFGKIEIFLFKTVIDFSVEGKRKMIFFPCECNLNQNECISYKLEAGLLCQKSASNAVIFIFEAEFEMMQLSKYEVFGCVV